MNATNHHVALAHGFGVAGLRSISGAEELAINGADCVAAIELLDQLLVTTPLTTIGPGSTEQIPISERDKLLAHIYIQLFGAEIENAVQCPHCREQFELTFSVNEIVQRLANAQAETMASLAHRLQQNEDMSFTLDANSQNEVTFDLPNGTHELALLNAIGKEQSVNLMELCVRKSEPGFDQTDLETLIESIAPTIDIELQATCTECHRTHTVDFSLQDYLLTKLASDRHLIQQQIHVLASRYQWSLPQILSLSRQDRLSFYQLSVSDGGYA